jgi:hypothetical protein
MKFSQKPRIFVEQSSNNFWSATKTNVAGNSPFRGIVFCNLVPLNKLFQILSPLGKLQIETLYSSPCKNEDHPNDVLVGQKSVYHEKSSQTKCINSFLACKLSHDRWLCFLGEGACGSLPDADIWWCLRTGGGGILTRVPSWDINIFLFYLILKQVVVLYSLLP